MIEVFCNFDEVLKSDKPVLVDFYAPWCGHCNTMSPILNEVAIDLDKAKIAKVNVDENPEIAKKYNIMGLPTLIIFKCGKPVKEFRGVQSKENLLKELNKSNLYLKCKNE